MSKIPYKKCNHCGLYNDLTIDVCECGTDITNIPALLVEGEIPLEEYGEINEELSYYVQKCSACGALNFTADPSKPVKVCHNCHKARVASIVPVPYVDEEPVIAEPANAEPTPKEEPLSVIEQFSSVEEDDDDDEDYGQWSGIFGNIKQAVGQVTSSVPMNVEKTYEEPSDEEDDDDEDVGNWSSIFGNKEKESKKSDLTLTAIRYGRLSFTIKADGYNLPFMLGRSANHSDFLSQDNRVSNQHCFITYRDGRWYVKDNNSSNGTAVNTEDIGQNGECVLNNGDELKLGHHSDSMAFRVTII